MDRFNNIKPSEYGGFVGAGVVILIFVVIALLVDMSSLRNLVISAGIWGPLIFILLKISTVVFAPLSGSPLYPLVGLIFGFWPGILYIVIGDFLAFTISFTLSRVFGRELVNKLLSGKEESMIAKIVDHIGTGKGFFQACLAMFALPEVLSYGAGLGKLNYAKFITIIMPFEIVAASILVFFGSILNPDSGSLLIGLGIPLLGAIFIITGGTLFMRGLKEKGV